MRKIERRETRDKTGAATITTKYIVKNDGSSVAVVRAKVPPPKKQEPSLSQAN